MVEKEKERCSVGDTLKVGLTAEKGKLIDIVYRLGTYAMYKVHLFTNWEILTIGKISSW